MKCVKRDVKSWSLKCYGILLNLNKWKEDVNQCGCENLSVRFWEDAQDFIFKKNKKH